MKNVELYYSNCSGSYALDVYIFATHYDIRQLR